VTDDDRPSASREFSLAPDVVIRKVGDEAIALKLSTESVYSLNETAARVALLIEQGVGIDAMVTRLATEYGQPPDAIAAHVNVLVADFTAKGLIERTDSQETA
jgi:hypothetical protein